MVADEIHNGINPSTIDLIRDQGKSQGAFMLGINWHLVPGLQQVKVKGPCDLGYGPNCSTWP